MTQFLTRSDGSTGAQLLRYGMVSAVALAVDVGVLVALQELSGVSLLWSNTLGFCAGLVTNFLLSRFWVFAQAKITRVWLEFGLFAAIGVIGLVLNDAIVLAGTEWAGWHYLVSKGVATAVVFFWNFFARKHIIYR